MTTPIRTTIVLVNWNGYSDTLACLDSVFRMPETDFNVVVCDNGSSDGSVAAIKAWSDRTLTDGRRGAVVIGAEVAALTTFLTIVDTGANLGFAAANNIGIRLALKLPSVESVWLLNNDTEVEPDALGTMRRRMVEDRRIGICGSTLIYHHDRRLVQSVGVRFHVGLGYGHQIGNLQPVTALPSREVVENAITYVSGASMLVSRAFLKTVGLMDETLFLYGEELDWSLRSAGHFRMGWAPGSIVYHKEGASIGTSSLKRQSDKAIYYQNRNMLRLSARYAPLVLPLALVRLTVRAARLTWRWDAKAGIAVIYAICDFLLRKSGQARYVD